MAHSRLVQQVRDAAGGVLRHLPALASVRALGAVREDDELAALAGAASIDVQDALRDLKKQGRDAEVALHRSRADLAEAQERFEGFGRVVAAVKAVDAFLAERVDSAVTARTREGRASLWNGKLDEHLRNQSALVPKDADSSSSAKDTTSLGLSDSAALAIRNDLVDGTAAWIDYSCSRVADDLKLRIYQEWTVLEDDLPIPDPVHSEGAPLADLTVPRPWRASPEESGWWSAFPVPEVSRPVTTPGLWGELGRTIRQNGFLVVMALTLAGLSRSEAMLAGAVLLVPVGWVMVQRDRTRKREASEEAALKEVQADVERWANGRLARTETKVAGHIRFELRTSVRQRWVEWYREQVQPRVARADRARTQAKEEVQRAEDRLRAFQAKDREQRRALDALAHLLAQCGASAQN